MNNTYPLISIVIPVYNGAHYVGRCLDSIRAQEYYNFEVIIVNDGSTDNSMDIIQHYSNNDKRFKVYNTENRGASLARKFGLEHTNGKYITFIDSDDYVHRTYLSVLYDILINSNCRISVCGYNRKGLSYHLESEKNYTRYIYENELFRRFFKYEFWGFWGKLYDKDILENVVFPKATLSEDYYVMCHLFYQERRVIYTSKELYCWEFHNNSLSHHGIKGKYFEEFENVYSVYTYICKNLSKYRSLALGNVAETCMKILQNIKYERESYKDIKNICEIKCFLLSHFWKIMFCPQLRKGIKYGILKILILE